MSEATKKDDRPLLVIVTGLSGAGKSIAIRALEDLSFYCIDNLPLDIIDSAVDFIHRSKDIKRFAIGMDIRSRHFAEGFAAMKQRLGQKLRLDVLFLTADEETVARRYGTTRRKHPLLDVGGELVASIRREAALLEPVELAADVRLDTSIWSPHQLARAVEERYSDEVEGRHLNVTIVSFGFKHGMLRPADSIYDVRFLKNPHFDPALNPKTGLDQVVRDYIFSDPLADEFLERLVDFHEFLLPQYHREGKHYFRIGIGCTGGKHRSVTIAELLAHALAEKHIPNILVSVSHRDLSA